MADQHLVDAARLLRRYHDLVSGFVAPPDARWRLVAPTRAELICHNDWAPWNVVFRDGRVAVMLDWDMAGPGTRVWDLANAAYSWVPLYPRSAPRFTLERQSARLRQFLDAYGFENRVAILPTINDRLLFIADFFLEQSAKDEPGFQKLIDWDVPGRLRRDAAELERNGDVFARALA